MTPAPKNIFELINLNIVELSQDLVTIADKVDKIYQALYPEMENTAPNTLDAEHTNDNEG